MDVALATGRTMPVPDLESHLLVEALAARGISAALVPWGREPDGALVVVRSTWDYCEHRADFLAWAHGVPRLTNPAEVVGWSSHKAYLLDLAAAGVPIVPTTLVPQGASADLPPGEVVVKPAVSAGARDTRRGSDLAGHLERLSREGDVIVQPFVPEVTEGEVSLMWLGGTFSHAVRKVPATGGWLVQHEHGGRVVDHEPAADELAVAEQALAQVTRPLSHARVDLVRTAAGPLVMELELVEPELFLSRAGAADRFAGVIAGLLI